MHIPHEQTPLVVTTHGAGCNVKVPAALCVRPRVAMLLGFTPRYALKDQFPPFHGNLTNILQSSSQSQRSMAVNF